MEEWITRYHGFREFARRGKELGTQTTLEKVASAVATFLPEDSSLAMISKFQAQKR